MIEAAIRTDHALSLVAQERIRQDDKWGSFQSHPDGTHERYEAQAERYRDACNEAAAHPKASGGVTWRHIFLEEVFEALTETDPAKLREELIQALAVGVAWIEDIDGRT